jgi:hypothetical protein
MKPEDIEALYLTPKETAEVLGVTPSRVGALERSGLILKLKGSIYDRASVEAYLAKRGDRKGGRYPKT